MAQSNWVFTGVISPRKQWSENFTRLTTPRERPLCIMCKGTQRPITDSDS